MSTDPSDSAYDLAPVPRQRPRNAPPPIPEPVQLTYQRIEPKTAPQSLEPKQIHKLSPSERLFYWLRRLGSVFIILLGALWLIFVFLPDRGIWTMIIGSGLIGLGFTLFIFSGPSDAEKRGYHF
jgi:hypothetical protein